MQRAITLPPLPLGDSYITPQLFLLLFFILSQNFILLDCILVHLTLQTGTVHMNPLPFKIRLCSLQKEKYSSKGSNRVL